MAPSELPMYVAVLLYASSSPDPGYTPMYEECFLLLRATGDEEARILAEQRVEPEIDTPAAKDPFPGGGEAW